MTIFLVNQRDTFDEEIQKRLFWAPQKGRNGRTNKGWENLKLVKQGDFFIHNHKASISAISQATEDYKKGNNPFETENSWNKEGYLVEKLKILQLNKSLKFTPSDREVFISFSKNKESAFNCNGYAKLQYLSVLPEDEANYFLDKIKKECKELKILDLLNSISPLSVEEDSYTDKEKFAIDTFINCDLRHLNISETQELIKQSSGKVVPKRNPQIAAFALQQAHFKCEADLNHKTFTKANTGKPYTEPHHLIPISKYKDFSNGNGTYKNLDIPENIVSLCSHCHNLIHYGCLKEKEPLLAKLFDNRVDLLKAKGIKITFNELLKYYK